ncbi:MAG: ATP-dependent DNA helicase RecG [Gammaproteobacteria bacterium]
MLPGKGKTYPITELKGVGPKTSSSLSSMGIETILDSVFHLPFRYEDRTRITPIADTRINEESLIEGEIVSSTIVFRGRRQLFVEIYDGTGRLTMRMFHFAFAQQKGLKKGDHIRCFGTIRHGQRNKEMFHPQYKTFQKNEIPPVDENLTPIYPTTSGITQGRLGKVIQDSLIYCKKNKLLEEKIDEKSDTLIDSLSFIHSPPNDIDMEVLALAEHPIQKSLIKEELTAHILCSGILKKESENRMGPSLKSQKESEVNFFNSLEFDLTNSQTKVWNEIKTDLLNKNPMHRLLQGDVGSGKTVVAALSALLACKNGYQVALMCPTEILAEQHFKSFSKWFDIFDLKINILLGSTKAKERKEVLGGLKNSEIDLIIGTHSLFQKDIRFNNLGLTIIDEQHRFGVHQRFSLLDKGKFEEDVSPHQLIMTATPIPRTLAMTVYGSLDTSIIDELPPGRKPVRTSSRPNSLRDKVINRVSENCHKGQRAYWVCTLIEDSEELEAQAAEELYKEISNKIPDIMVGLVHGKLNKNSKDKVIESFRNGKIQLLVCTTVIEVGVDVPEATLMIIENPERLGLSQLHQLRGRVGRKENSESHCLLLHNQNISELAKERIKVMENTNDGFKIAEKDLELRGSGDIYGLRQSGLMNLRIANPIRDSELLEEAQYRARKIAKEDKRLAYSLVDRWIGTRIDYSDS